MDHCDGDERPAPPGHSLRPLLHAKNPAMHRRLRQQREPGGAERRYRRHPGAGATSAVGDAHTVARRE